MLSAVIIAQNEAHRIGRCLQSVAFADEIVVVDGGSIDATPEVAELAGARLVRRPFTDFRAQHDFADEIARGPWVLSVDADEIVPPALAREVREAIASGSHDAYRVPHLDFVFGKWVRHGGWYPQHHVRLYRKGCGRWVSSVHEKWQGVTAPGTLHNPIHHYSHLRVSDFIEKLNRYTSESARLRALSGERIALWRLVLEPPAYFVYKYLIQGGFLDGGHGFTLASLLAFYRLAELAKVRFQPSERNSATRDHS